MGGRGGRGFSCVGGSIVRVWTVVGGICEGGIRRKYQRRPPERRELGLKGPNIDSGRWLIFFGSGMDGLVVGVNLLRL